MGDSTLKNIINTPQSAAPDISHLLSSDAHSAPPTSDSSNAGSNSMSFMTKAERVGQVTLEGLANTPAGILHSAEDFIKPENWGKDALMIGSSAAFGFLMRTALPESGAFTTAAGLIMGGMFLKDGAMPMIHAWGTVTSDGSSQAMRAAATQMGEGLGNFAVEGGVSMAAAGLASKFTPDAWNKVAPKQWNAIETFKADHLSNTSPLGASLSSFGVKFTGKLRGIADSIDPPKPSIADLSPEEIARSVASSQKDHIVADTSEKLYRNGLRGSNGLSHGLDGTVDILLKGEDPRVVPAPEMPSTTAEKLASTDLTQPNSIVLTGDTQTAEVAARHGKGPKAPKPVDTSSTTDQTTVSDNGAGGGGSGNQFSKILNAKTMGAQADVIKAQINSITDQEGMVADAIHRTTGAVEVRTNPNVKPLLGYDEPRQAMLNLAEQVGTDAGSYMQVGDLFTRFADASVQSGTANVSDLGADIARFNRYASENRTTYEQNMIKAGIDPKKALERKVVAPLGEATSDLEQIGVDKSGNPVYAHEGPHTVRAIYGPKGEPIWPIDLVKRPIREMGMRGVNTSGIYGHELMHDQFGRLGEFDPEVRDAKLGDAASKAWGADAQKPVDLPNGGLDPQQVLLNNIARQAEKVPADQKDAFLTEALQIDPQTKVVKAARAADQLLGQTGRQMVQVPGNGAMPLEIFVANLAAMADTRDPAEVLLEAQGKGNPQATAQLVETNVAKLLGPNGDTEIPLADGSTASLKDVVMQVSDASRDPHFKTYDQPLPKTMTNQDILVNLAKGWADETFADWGAAAESGQTAAPYFQALRKDGLLSNGTVMGQEMRSPDNPLGVEAHPVDKLRPRYQAALIRTLATAKGGHDQVLLDWANALDQYSRDAGKPGDITLANMDAPGQKITIPETVMDNFISELASQQVNTPLPRLQGRTLLDILPDLRKNFRVNDSMSNDWATAIKNGESPDTLPFDKNTTKITNVYGAGQLAFLKLVADGMDPMKANDAVNAYSDYFGNKYIESDPHAQTPFIKKLQLAPGRTLSELPRTFTSPLASTLRSAQPDSPTANWFQRNANTIAGGSTGYLFQDLAGMHKVQQEVLNNGQ